MRVLGLLLAAIASIASAKTVLPATKEGNPIGIIILQGAQIPEDNYVPLGKAIQDKSNLGVWVSIPHCGLNLCEPAVVGGTINDGIKQLKKAGFPDGAPIILSGHSLGGAFVQDWVVTNVGKVDGQILLGSYITRKNRGTPFPVPNLTLAGSLDGLTRVSRIAESYYHEVLHADDKGTNSPVVVIPGMSHMQFATGVAPSLVKKRDFKPEMTLDEALDISATVIAAFFNQNFGTKGFRGSSSDKIMKAATEQTGEYVMPLITALEMEGYVNFKPPCNSDNVMAQCPFYPRYPDKQKSSKIETDCTCATSWSVTAQNIMAGLPESIEIKVTDAIHSVSDINPIHLPHIWSSPCKDEAACSINVTTVTESIHSTLDSLDTAYGFVSADELRTKLKSRQTMWNAAGRADADFHATDEVESTCADINKAAYQWALDNAHPSALQRFQKYGQKYEFAEDTGPYNVGPTWIYNNMSYKENVDKSATVITSPMSHTKSNYIIKSAAGFHYCKLLSPARAMEWIYVDSLRNTLGLNNSEDMTELEYFLY